MIPNHFLRIEEEIIILILKWNVKRINREQRGRSDKGLYAFGLGLKLSYVPQSLPNAIKDLSIGESNEVKLLLLNDYLLKCQEEMTFTGVFKQELPQSRSLLTDAIEALKEEMRKTRIAMGLESESSPEDVLATKKRGSDEQQGLDLNNPCSDQWSNTPTHHHHNKEQICGSLSIDPSPSMEVNLTVGENQEPVSYKMKPLTQCIWKNNRRSWTPELHARFAVVLHLLGGPEVATPKQIRDQMQVEGLTTNQVKSHLQKYRMNWRSSPEGAADPQRRSKLFCRNLARPPSAAADAINMEEIN
ncbi:transcription factor HHO5 [Manihot esculenta]|uniref:Uncharacterized protein n=1 Tax=Manihot esculenta TaxID=3983 RepID=A0ACB7ICD0_MANES|nr:transcription factor HHO5 [Manihot esculenta]KAG8662410.1 hypothetical protein MANES_01G103800v8 [Manihot esculenta]